jgi:N-acetyl-gamma-glutamyl-phosphate reductase
MSKSVRVGIVGISGYSGMELARIVAGHPELRLQLAISDKWAGKRLGTKMPLYGDIAGVEIVSQEAGQTRFGDVDLLFFCTPPEASIELAPRALATRARIVDLSGGFRLPASDYPTWYGFSHAQPALLAEAVYSMPEATGGGERLRQARLVSNPGCYPTASTLAVLPLLQAGLVDPGSLIIDAKSGTTGAGRKGTEELSFSEVDEDLRAYRVLKHQHTPEIERALERAGVPGARVVFTPHLLPTRRGILATAYARLTPQAKDGDVAGAVARAFESFVEGRPFLALVPPEEVTLHAAVGTNRVVLGARADASRGIVVVCASIDNLVKGAAGQAVQNANLMLGLPETAGLDVLTGHAP